MAIGSSGHQKNVGLRINSTVGCVPPPIGMSQADPDRVKTRKLSENGAYGANFFALPGL